MCAIVFSTAWIGIELTRLDLIYIRWHPWDLAVIAEAVLIWVGLTVSYVISWFTLTKKQSKS
jgi:hypothetical protein